MNELEKLKRLSELAFQENTGSWDSDLEKERTNLMKECVQALKLQESVKEIIEHKLLYPKIGNREACLVTVQTIELLKSLVDESEK